MRFAFLTGLACAIAGSPLRAERVPSLSNAGNTASGAPSVLSVAARYPAESRYGIWRKGTRIGEHRLRFTDTAEGGLQVDIESAIRVTMLKIPVFRFEYVAQERWELDGLRSVDVRVSENGASHVTSLRTEGTGSLLSGPDGASAVPPIAFASNHWHDGVLQSNRVFNTLTGTVSNVTIDAIGRDTLDVSSSGAPDIEYTRHRYSGEIDAESWYDDAGRWVGLAFEGEDGSRIEYRLEP